MQLFESLRANEILSKLYFVVFQLSAEERERLILRRERNKQAAARCRNRRRDLTMTLQQQTEDWQQKNAELEREIEELLNQKDQLEFLLSVHESRCNLLQLNNNQYQMADRIENGNPSAGPTTAELLDLPTTGPYDLSSAEDSVAIKQEPQDLSIKANSVSSLVAVETLQLPSNLVNQGSSKSAITNNNTHYYVPQCHSPVPSPSTCSPHSSTSVPTKFVQRQKTPNKAPSTQQLLIEANYNRSMVSPMKQQLSNVSTGIGSPMPSMVSNNSNMLSSNSNSYSPPPASGGPLLSDSPRAMQKQQRLQRQSQNIYISSPGQSNSGGCSSVRIVDTSSVNESSGMNPQMLASDSLLEDGRALINELFEDDTPKHFTAL